MDTYSNIVILLGADDGMGSKVNTLIEELGARVRRVYVEGGCTLVEPRVDKWKWIPVPSEAQACGDHRFRNAIRQDFGTKSTVDLVVVLGSHLRSPSVFAIIPNMARRVPGTKRIFVSTNVERTSNASVHPIPMKLDRFLVTRRNLWCCNKHYQNQEIREVTVSQWCEVQLKALYKRRKPRVRVPVPDPQTSCRSAANTNMIDYAALAVLYIVTTIGILYQISK